MHSIRIDQFEFDDPGSEEAIEIDVARPSKFAYPNVSAFVGAVVGIVAAAALVEPEPFYRVFDRSRTSEYLKRFANIDVPLHADWPTYKLETESRHQTHLVICAPSMFIRYQWSTSA